MPSLVFQGKYAEAQALYGRCLEIQEKAQDPDDASTATTLNNLAGLSEIQVRTVRIVLKTPLVSFGCCSALWLGVIVWGVFVCIKHSITYMISHSTGTRFDCCIYGQA